MEFMCVLVPWSTASSISSHPEVIPLKIILIYNLSHFFRGITPILLPFLLMYHQGGNYQFSEHFGGHGGHKQEFMRPNLSLVGVKGRCGDSLDAIQFLFVDINTGQHL